MHRFSSAGSTFLTLSKTNQENMNLGDDTNELKSPDRDRKSMCTPDPVSPSPFTSMDTDPEVLFGKTVASELKLMDRAQRALVKRMICEAIYAGHNKTIGAAQKSETP